MVKVEVGKLDKSKKEYPKLMISKSGKIVMMRGDGRGVVLITENPEVFNVGDDFNGFAMENFKDYDGTVTLSNG